MKEPARFQERRHKAQHASPRFEVLVDPEESADESIDRAGESSQFPGLVRVKVNGVRRGDQPGDAESERTAIDPEVAARIAGDEFSQIPAAAAELDHALAADRGSRSVEQQRRPAIEGDIDHPERILRKLGTVRIRGVGPELFRMFVEKVAEPLPVPALDLGLRGKRRERRRRAGRRRRHVHSAAA
ncbi:MAG TPA: hypothetical protein VFS34_04415 [Thermoanaerobaculia bacterium]|nr:hypothetical protein [Thermoanaerobaculia bacterium]